MTGMGDRYYDGGDYDELPEDDEREEILARIEEEADRKFDEQRDARWDKEHR